MRSYLKEKLPTYSETARVVEVIGILFGHLFCSLVETDALNIS
jgi:hypothetical protein